MSQTIDAIRSQLGRGAQVYRYDGMQSEEGTFVASAFWIASALACVGRMDEATAQFDAVIAMANDIEMYAEQLDAESGDFLGNVPQALSHLALINAAITIDEVANAGGVQASARTR
jgi:GH15 family glucan-1,4-alpha-glucosidase